MGVNFVNIVYMKVTKGDGALRLAHFFGGPSYGMPSLYRHCIYVMPRYSLRVNIVRPNDGPHLLPVFLQNELSKHIEQKGFGNFRELKG